MATVLTADQRGRCLPNNAILKIVWSRHRPVVCLHGNRRFVNPRSRSLGCGKLSIRVKVLENLARNFLATLFYIAETQKETGSTENFYCVEKGFSSLVEGCFNKEDKMKLYIEG